ncbi:MAG: cell wall anchor protein, partial [Pseudonocardiaceae bacterium]
MDGTARVHAPNGGRSEFGAGGGDAAALIDSALQLRWRAPEVTLLLAERAAAWAGEDATAALRAEQLVAASLNALGRGAEVIGRALAAVRCAEDAGATGEVAPLRVELGGAAVEAGDPAAALAVLRPILVPGAAAVSQVRASALVHGGSALMLLGRPGDGDRAFAEADDHYQGSADPDAVLLRAALRARRAARHRRDG